MSAIKPLEPRAPDSGLSEGPTRFSCFSSTVASGIGTRCPRRGSGNSAARPPPPGLLRAWGARPVTPAVVPSSGPPPCSPSPSSCLGASTPAPPDPPLPLPKPSPAASSVRQVPAPAPGGTQGEKTLPHHRGAARARGPGRAAVAPRAAPVPQRQGPAHQRRSVSQPHARHGGGGGGARRELPESIHPQNETETNSLRS